MLYFKKFTVRRLNLFIIFGVLISFHTQAQLYPPVTAEKTTEFNRFSPDPIFNYKWANPQASDGLESYTLKPISWKASVPAHFDLTRLKKNNIIIVNGEGYIRFDFGQNNAGWFEFDSPDPIGTVEMSVSEYNEIPPHLSSYPTKTLSPKKYGNTYRLELNPELYEGVQFAWINVKSFSQTWRITDVRLVCQTKPANYNGSFSCSDSLLTKIWYTGAYTVKLNLLKEYFGAILMNRGDRFSWTGDAHPAQAASMVAFANYDFVKQNIAYTSTQSNGIRSYALYWVLSLIDYYNYTGDEATLEKYMDNAGAKLDDAYKVYGTNPHLEFFGWDERLGSGFEHPNLPEPQNAYKMLSIRVWKAFADAMLKLGRKDLATKYSRYAQEKMSALQTNKGWFNDFGLHASADAVTTGLLNNEEKRQIYLNSFNDKVNRISYSPFNQYFVIQAFAKLNKYDDAFSSIRDLWGGQIKYGGTTFFEDYRPSWNLTVGKNAAVPNNQCGFTSLCHPWGAGVTKWLTEEVLGIKPTSPGFKAYAIIPNLGRTLTNVSGNVQTPLGNISASFNTITGKGTFSSPAGTVGRIGIPKVEKEIQRITVNNKLVWDGKHHAIQGIGAVNEDEGFVYFESVSPGKYDIQVNYKGKTPGYTELKEIFPVSAIRTDSVTSGNWGKMYGKDGYVLCNYYGEGKDKASLPEYVSDVEYYKVKGNSKPLNVIWERETRDPRALAADQTNGFPRTAACLYAADGDQIGYTFTSTINLKTPRKYRVSLYFVDWDMNERQIGVEMFDAATSKLIAPVQIVRNSTKGTYLTFTYDKSAKFRINHVRGSNAVLSGIFFDQ
ncbi:MAG: alpha-L-rhamnosidase C-terminal domain-containing protein [Bacteroidota bacterium]